MTGRPLMPRRCLATSRSHVFAGQLAGLLHPGGELRFVVLLVLVDVEGARSLLLDLVGGDRLLQQRRVLLPQGGPIRQRSPCTRR